MLNLVVRKETASLEEVNHEDAVTRKPRFRKPKFTQFFFSSHFGEDWPSVGLAVRPLFILDMGRLWHGDIKGRKRGVL